MLDFIILYKNKLKKMAAEPEAQRHCRSLLLEMAEHHQRRVQSPHSQTCGHRAHESEETRADESELCHLQPNGNTLSDP